jgi:outer membrane receptor for ferrienterochelin and colicins
MKHSLLIPLGIMLPLAATNGVHAQETQLKNVFVTASRSEQSLDAVNASVEVITTEKIRSFAGRSLSEVLQFATGTLVKDSGSSSSFSLRGQDSDKTLILVDGLRRTEKYAGANLNNIQLEDVERIEIVRGPMSALYGSDALGGVINIISRGPQKGNEAGIRLMAGQTGDGQRATTIIGGFGNLGDGQLGHRLSFETKRRDSYRLPSSDTRITDLNNEQRDFLTYRGDTKTSLGRVDWGFELARQNDDGVGLTRTNTTYTKIEKDDRDFVHGGFRGRIGDGELTLRLGYGTSNSAVNRGTTLDETTLFKQTQLDSQYTFEPIKDHLTTLGYAYRQDDVDISTNTRRVVRNTNALFLQDSWTFQRDADLTIGLRQDDYSDFGGKLTPRVALAWRPGRWTFRSGLAQAFKAPSLLSLHMTSIIRGRYDLRGNPDLKPEESNSAEFATAYRFDRGQIEIAAHQSNVSNLIASIPTGARGPGCGATPTPATSCQIQENRNINKATIKGVEMSGNYKITDTWRVDGALEYLDARDGITDSRLTDRPKWVSKVALHWQSGAWQVDTRLRHTADWYAADPTVLNGLPFNSDYTTAAIRVAYNVSKKSEVFFGIDNLSNRLMPTNQTSRGTPDDPGSRFVYFGINTRL